MKITNLTSQVRDPNRINVSVDGKYRFSLDIYQISDLGIRIGKEYDEQKIAHLETESQFGKLYARALEYCLMRPHSSREVRDYLYRKTMSKRYRVKKTGEVAERPGVSQSVADRVFERLVEKGYVNDEAFARYWVENRHQTKGASQRKLKAELHAKGVDHSIVDTMLAGSDRTDMNEVKKIIKKKRLKYPDEKKMIAYLARQGFKYDDIIAALHDE